jgi:hypothetical protein
MVNVKNRSFSVLFDSEFRKPNKKFILHKRNGALFFKKRKGTIFFLKPKRNNTFLKIFIKCMNKKNKKTFSNR